MAKAIYLKNKKVELFGNGSSSNSSSVHEKEIEPFYITGFTDGEGCFSLSFRKVSRLKMGVEVRPTFSISQKKSKRNYKLLEQFRRAFKGGSVRADKRGLYKYETRSLCHIRSHVIPFFQKYPLQSEKLYHFVLFCEACSLVAAKQHLNTAGLLKIVSIAEKMNLSGQKRLALSDLRALLKKQETEVQTCTNNVMIAPLSQK